MASPFSVQFQTSTFNLPLTKSLPAPTLEKLIVCRPVALGVKNVFARQDHTLPTSSGTESHMKRSVFVLIWRTVGSPSNLSPIQNSKATPFPPVQVVQ